MIESAKTQACLNSQCHPVPYQVALETLGVVRLIPWGCICRGATPNRCVCWAHGAHLSSPRCWNHPGKSSGSRRILRISRILADTSCACINILIHTYPGWRKWATNMCDPYKIGEILNPPNGLVWIGLVGITLHFVKIDVESPSWL